MLRSVTRGSLRDTWDDPCGGGGERTYPPGAVMSQVGSFSKA
jgi:hypothetical protein